MNSIILKIVDYLSKQPAGDTQTAIRESLGLSGKVASEALNVAIERDWIKRESIKKNNRNIDGYVLKNAHPDNPYGQDRPS